MIPLPTGPTACVCVCACVQSHECIHTPHLYELLMLQCIHMRGEQAKENDKNIKNLVTMFQESMGILCPTLANF